MDNIRIFENTDDIAAAARDYVLQAAKESIADKGVFNFDLAGGSTPRKLYELLSAQTDVDWPKWQFFMGDERYVPLADTRSNYGLARDTLLAKLPIRDDQVHIVPVDEPTPAQAAERYEEQIRQHFHDQVGVPAFDLVLLGLGSDTHTASLFPGKAAVNETKRLVVASGPGVLPPPVDRVTFTLPLINNARRVLFMVTGVDKAEALRAVRRDLEKPVDAAATPAGKVRPAGELLWFVDQAAAS